jgi:hypothetical protein
VKVFIANANQSIATDLERSACAVKVVATMSKLAFLKSSDLLGAT